MFKDIKNGRFYTGDCLEIMKEEIPDSAVDMILCDLPYGTTGCSWDSIIPFDKLWKNYNRIIKSNGAIILTASQPFTSALISSNYDNYKYNLVWVKNVPTGMASASYMPMKYHEDICIFVNNGKPTFNKQFMEREGKGKDCYNYEHYIGESNHVKMKKIKKFYDPENVNPGSVLLFNTVPNRIGKIHPTQKPVSLFEYLIKTYSNENEFILDNCAGSGTTAIACENLNRKWICIEQSEEYALKAIERIENHKMNEK